MRKFLLYVNVVLFTLLYLNSSGMAGNKKLAQTGFQFLSVISDARGAALGEAMTATENQSSSLFFNPAGMANSSSFIDVAVSNNQWIADISHNTLSFSINPANGHYGVIGFSAQTIDYGEILGTRVAPDQDLGYEDTGKLDPSAISLGLGYAKALSDRFSVGGQVRYVKQDLGESIVPVNDSVTKTKSYELTPLAFDFGTLFKTGYKSLMFGMSVRNFSEEIEYEDEGFQLPLVFTFGISFNLLDFTRIDPENQSAILTIDASHFRSHPEQIKFGIDYRYMGLISLRGGYASSNDDNGLTFGFGLSYMGAVIDYAYTPFGDFDNVQRISLRFSM